MKSKQEEVQSREEHRSLADPCTFQSIDTVNKPLCTSETSNSDNTYTGSIATVAGNCFPLEKARFISNGVKVTSNSGDLITLLCPAEYAFNDNNSNYYRKLTIDPEY